MRAQHRGVCQRTITAVMITTTATKATIMRITITGPAGHANGHAFRGEGFELGQHEPGELRQEFVLKPGDCAYVPRGLMHDAQTSGDKASLHITVGLITRTWADLMLEAVSEVALRSPELRRSLPVGFAQSGFNRDPLDKH